MQIQIIILHPQSVNIKLQIQIMRDDGVKNDFALHVNRQLIINKYLQLRENHVNLLT